MQSEDFDKRVKEAADHHHPAYDEKAWDKMEKLLNKHMPKEEDNRKRILFFLLLFLLLGAGGAWLFTNKPWKSNNQVSENVKPVATDAKNQSNSTELPSNGSTTNGNNNNNNTVTTSIEPATPANTDKTSATSDVVTNNTSTSNLKPVKNNKSSSQPNNLANTGDKTPTTSDIVTNNTGTRNNKPVKNNKTNQPNNPVNDVKDDAQVDITTEAAGKTKKNTDKPVVSSDNGEKEKEKEKEKVVTTNNNAAPNSVVTTETKTEVKENLKEEKKAETPVATTTQKKKSPSKKSSSVFFSISAGPDMNATGSDKFGSTRFLTGAGIGYTYRDKVSIKTGFYSARKVYTASPDQYHPPDAFWTYYPYMEKIDADCKVYEIPLTLSYNFGKSDKHSWFASTGLSTYLMKSEKYNFFYKNTPSGQTLNYKYAINNENKHFFSVLTLSGGYQRNFGKYVSVMAEPYVKLPLGGVGFGKVKLNSAGLLMTVAVRPIHFKSKSSKTSN